MVELELGPGRGGGGEPQKRFKVTIDVTFNPATILPEMYPTGVPIWMDQIRSDQSLSRVRLFVTP